MQSGFTRILTFLIISLFPASATFGESVLVADLPVLEAQREAMKAGAPEAAAEGARIFKAADKALEGGLLSVTDKTSKTPAGDKHDYLSLSPYWWPDPGKPDGLPYIRRDGRVNPETRGEHVDYDRKRELFKRLRALGPAAFLSDDPKYGEMAVKLLQTWFIDPATKMNPNLKYAQGTPGRSDGRPYGIIEWSGIGDVLMTVQLLRAEKSLPEPLDHALVAWFAEYAQWLQTSKLGIAERDTKNNHGTWYDVQLVTILLFLQRPEEAKDIIEKVKNKRIASQIEPDGRQPHELARTKSLSYSRMNLAAFKKLAELGKQVDIDLWNFETEDGRSIQKAEKYILSNTNGGKKWPHPQL